MDKTQRDIRSGRKLFAVGTALLAMVALAGRAQSSTLSELAHALPEKTFVKITGNAGLNALALESSIMYWTNSAVWDPVKKQIRWMGGPGTCCSDPPVYKMITYNDATDAWSVTPTAYTGSGHGYDGNALDPATGLHYFAQKDESQVRVWNGADFSLLPPAPVSPTTTPSLTWFPDMNSGAGGLLLMGNEGKLAWYNGTQWTSIPGMQVTGYDNFSEYNPVHKVVWLGGGSGSYRLSANLTLTQLAAAPFNLEGNACALHSCDPVSGLYIVTNLADNSWWTFDIMADAWTRLTGLTGQPDLGTSCGGSGNNQFQVPISDYGVILYANHNTTPLSVYLYKHAKSATQAANPSRPRRAAFAVRITQPSFGANLVMTWTGTPDPVRVELHDLQGRLILSRWGEKNSLEWNSGDLSERVYLLKVSTAGNTVTRKIIVNR